MLRSPINLFILFNLLLICVFFIACGFIDLRQIKYSVEPRNFDSVLENQNSPIIISFDTEMNKKETEGVVRVSSDLGAVKGDFHWLGNNLYFTPVAGWTAGIRYSLNLNGTIRSIDGRELRLQHFVSFYAINKETPPALESHYPLDGESIGTNDFILELHFSVPMNRLSVESALSIDGVTSKNFKWEDNDKVLKVIADKLLSAWTSYSWILKDSARSADGVPLPKQYSGSFTTNLDQTLPEVVRVYPVAYSQENRSWSATGADIETGLTLNEGIAVEFSKPMGENVLRSLRFEPSLTGRTEMLTENKIVYIFSRNPEPETKYTLIVSADTRDTEGLKIGDEYRLYFLPDIPYLNITSVNDDNNLIRVSEGAETVEFSIGFSSMFNNEEKQIVTQRIIFYPFFPKSLPATTLQYVKWASNDRIIMRWEGLKAGDEETTHYYRLTIPGGKGGISAGGLYMKEDININLEAVNEK